MSLSVSFRVVAMRADESMEHSITIAEQRRPLDRAQGLQAPPPMGGPINPGRGLLPGQMAAEAQHVPPALITLPVTPEQFASCRIGMVFELEMPATVGALSDLRQRAI